MKNYQIVLFDLDGTLTDPGVGITNSVAYALKKYGIEVADKTQLYPFIGPPLSDSFEKYYGFSEEEAHEWLERTFKRYEEDGFGHYAVELRETGKFVGMVGMIRETLGGKELLGIGWILRKDCWGHGYATEAAQAVLHDAFERLGAKEIVADIRPENTASIRVAERLGMRAEYEVVKRYRGKDMPHIVYVARSSANKMDIK